MAWDARRPVPWKRLGLFLGLYAAVMIIVTALTDRDRIGPALVSVAFGIVVAGSFLVILSKFGWTMPILRSREEIAAARAQRMAAKAARSGATTTAASVPGPRPKAAATSRTSTGRSQHPRRTGSSRRK